MTRWDKPSARVVPAKRAKRLRVGKAVLGQMEDAGGGNLRNQLRLLEIERLINFRRGYATAPISDEAYLRAAYPTLLFAMHEANCPSHRRSPTAWMRACLPSLMDRSQDEFQDWFREIDTEFTTSPRSKPRRSDGIGRDLAVTWEERETLGITQLGFVGGTAEVLAEIRRIKDRQRKKLARRQAGSIDRLDYEADSASNAEPWLREGICRRTWERRRKAARVASPSANAEDETGASANAAVASPSTNEMARVASPSAASIEDTDRAGRTCDSDDPSDLRHPAAGGRRQAETDLEAAVEAAGVAAERERSELLAEAVARPPARPARASHSPRAPRSTAPAQLQAPLAPAAGKRGRPSRRFGEFEMIEVAGVVIGEACMDRRRCWVAIHRGRTIGTHRTKGAAVEDVRRREQQLEMPLVGVIEGGPPAPSPAPTKPARRPRMTPAERAADQIVKESLKAAKDAERASARFYQDVIQRSSARRRTSAQSGMWIYGRPSRRR